MNIDSVSKEKNLKFNPLEWLPKVETVIKTVTPFGDLLLRCWVAYAFWVSGLTKIQTWSSTLYLFENEYAVPLLSPDIAAVVGTSIEQHEVWGIMLLVSLLHGPGKWSVDAFIKQRFFPSAE
jgi:putative oxidoreductase